MTDKIEQIKKAITNKRVSRDVLTIEATLKIKKYVRDEKIFFLTEDVKKAMSEEYEIIDVIKTDKICNWLKIGFAQNGVWKFKIKKKPSTRKKPPQPKKEQEITEPIQKEEKPQPPPQPQKSLKKPSKQTSFRGRIKKIADKK